MATSSEFTDPVWITRDTTTNVGVDARDARYGLGAFLRTAPGTSLSYVSGIWPSRSDSSGNILDATIKPSSGMTVTVDPCNYTSARDNLGAYTGAIVAAAPVTLAGSDPTYYRYDVVVIRVQEPGVDGTLGTPANGSNPAVPGAVAASAFLVALQGIPSATPSVSDALQNKLPGDVEVGQITIRPGSNSVLAVDISPRRTFLATRGGAYIKSTFDDLASPYPGAERINGGVLELGVAGGGWVPSASPLPWTAFTPSLRTAAIEVGLGTGGTKYGRFKQIGKDLYVDYEFKWGARPYSGGTGPVFTTLPPGFVTAAGRDQTAICELITRQSGTTVVEIWNGHCYVPPASNYCYPKLNNSASDTRYGYYRIANTLAGSTSQGVPFVSGGEPTGGQLNIWMKVEVV